MTERARYISEEGPIRVLHVDDDACFLKTAKAILVMQGTIQVETASSVEEAVGKMKTEKYDVVVCDYQMPRKDGLQFLKDLREKRNSIPFIIFTGKGREEVAIKALNLGADGYFSKMGHPETVYGELAHGISQAVETKKTEQKLAFQAHLLSSVHDALTATDENFIITYWNQIAEEMFGWTAKEAIGQTAKELFQTKVPGSSRTEAIDKLLKDGFYSGEVYYCRKGGTYVLTDVHSTAVRSPRGEFKGTVSCLRDITERKKAEEQAEKTSEELTRTFDAITDFVFNIDRDYRIVRVNKKICEALKKKPEELVGKRCYEVVHGTDKPFPSCPHKRTLETGKAASGEINDPNLGLTLLVSNSPIFDERGELIQCVHVAKDITEHKKAVKSLLCSEEKFRNIFESATDVMVLFDATGRILDVNKKAVEAFGGSKGELVGKHFTRAYLGIMSPTQISKVVKGFAAGLANKKPDLDVSIKNKKGQTTLLECSGSLLKLDDKSTRLLVVGRDITERKRAEEELTRSEAKYRSLVELAPDGIVAVNAEGIVTSANRSFLTLVGYDSEEIVGKPFTELKTMEMEGIPKFQGMFKSLMKGESASPIEFFYVRRDGTSRWAEVHPSLLIKDGKPVGAQVIMRDVSERKNLEEVLRKREAELSAIIENTSDSVWSIDNKGCLLFANTTFKRQFLLTYGVELKEGMDLKEMVPKAQIPFWVETHNRAVKGGQFSLEQKLEIRGVSFDFEISVNPIINENGETVGAAYFSRDITERKKVLERVRVLNEKLGVVGKLTRHDVRNKLAAVVGNTYLTKKTLPNDHKALDYLQEIESACRQTTRVLDFAVAYESLGVEGLTLIEVDKAVEEAVSLISELKGVKVMNNCQGLTVMADSALRQLFFNLIDNSLKHGKNVSQIKIHYEEGKDRLKLFYEDNGVGIPKANKPKLFHVGFTTGNVGYGLPLIKSMMEIYGWTIEEVGEPGKGAKFVITIPNTHITMRAHETYP